MDENANHIHDTMKLAGKDIPVRRTTLSQAELKFFPENPRIYSVVNVEGRDPSQAEILEKMEPLEHVKRLYQSIKKNGGLIDPLIVQEGSLIVFEGNSRLAAYRLLARTDPIKWGYVKCCMLPEDIDTRHIATLLGEYHIIGRKDWSPYEQAGYLWRQHIKHKVPVPQIASELSLSTRKINSMIDVFAYMIDQKDMDPQRWSYYEEFLKSRIITKAREEFPELEKVVVGQIKSGKITKAVDIRDKVEKVAKVGGKTLKQYISHKKDLEECYEIAVAKGVTNYIYNKLSLFRKLIADVDIKHDFRSMDDSQSARCVYELKKINKEVDRIIKDLS